MAFRNLGIEGFIEYMGIHGTFVQNVYNLLVRPRLIPSCFQSFGNRFFKKEKIVKIISNKTINVIVVYPAIKMD